MLYTLAKNLLHTPQNEWLLNEAAGALFGLSPTKNPTTIQKRYKNGFRLATLNAKVIPYHLDKIWPFWVNRQLNPRSATYTSTGFQYHLSNTTARNWTQISLPNYLGFATVDPTGLLTLMPQLWSSHFSIQEGENKFNPIHEDAPKQTLLSAAGIQSTWFHKELSILTKDFVSRESESNELAIRTVTLQNRSADTRTITLNIHIYPFNPEGITPISNLVYLTQNGLMVNGKLGLILDDKPSNVLCYSHIPSSIENVSGYEMILKHKDPLNLGSSVISYVLTIPSQNEVSITLKFPIGESGGHIANLSIKNRIQAIRQKKGETLLEESQQKTHLLLEKSAHISVPDERWNTLFNHSRHHVLTPPKAHLSTSFFDQELSPKNAYFEALALLKLGQEEKAAEWLNSAFLTFQKTKDGTQAAQAGQLLCLINQYNAVTHHNPFKASIRQLTQKLTKVILSARAKKTTEPHTFEGLLTVTNSLDPSGKRSTSLWDNFWALGGLISAAELCQRSGLQTEFQLFAKHSNAVLESLNQYFKRTDALFGSNTPLPASLDRQIDSSIIFSLCSIYPLRIYTPNSTFATNTLKLLQSQFMVKDALFNTVGCQGYSIFGNFILARVLMERNIEEAMPIIQWIIDHASPTGCFPEYIHPISLGGSAGEGHHRLANALWILLIADMLIKETERGVTLTPNIPQEWTIPGKTISYQNRLTRFGKVSFSIRFEETSAKLNVSANWDVVPQSLKIRLPIKIHALCPRDGRETIVSGHEIELSPKATEWDLKYSQ